MGNVCNVKIGFKCVLFNIVRDVGGVVEVDGISVLLRNIC